ncbi:branched-chain amino acid transport system II carrier protein [Thalassobacillus pellis]|uniref:branched-chain amino acid transport system II carrier protein n=1 Tax=Thalassobacillus pellis TaxID=748008 RepID=UPI001961A558|nr:branched-chain amino acid transport system II carrier protein [Thalassobacillus pellis]MBM7551875.1 LIVCS family branched-chain amino acid:cation transporter [Thalassobacillus pellis]
MKRRDTVFIGFTLFALFFGAGNLIYPTSLGIEAGTSYWPAIAGFVLTGVGIPVITVTAISLIRNGTIELGSRVHPLFGLLFTAAIYLAIGPFFGIPRAANVAFEMGVQPLAGGSAGMLLLFTIIFFALVFWVSLNPSKIVDRIGQWLTPLLLLSIIGLVIGSFFLLDGSLIQPTEKYQSTPFFTGFLEGYLTMDAIAALAFGIIVITALKERGVTDQKEITRYTLKVGAVTATGLTAVYTSIGWIGAKMASEGSYANGGEILSGAANLMYGQIGTVLLGIIVALACFTTCVGLTVACGQFFNRVFPKLSYNIVITVITLISFAVSNVGLNQIIAYSVPVLVFIYPIAIVLVILAFTHRLFNGSLYVYRGAILMTSIISLYDGLVAFGIDLSAVEGMMQQLPLFSLGLGWVIPAIIGALGGLLFHLFISSDRLIPTDK